MEATPVAEPKKSMKIPKLAKKDKRRLPRKEKSSKESCSQSLKRAMPSRRYRKSAGSPKQSITLFLIALFKLAKGILLLIAGLWRALSFCTGMLPPPSAIGSTSSASTRTTDISTVS